jgi:CubicO group peptidase (beta-lactamase class C family)
LLQQLTGVSLAAGTIWTWVQQVGQRVMAQLADEVAGLAAGTLPPAESVAAELEALPLVMGADGVMVPFRPHPGPPKGKTHWREITVAILARLGERLTRQGKRVTRLCQRRLVAVLGTIDDLTPRWWREAVRQRVRTAAQVVWLSDGGRGFWTVFQRCFQAVGATAILDFYQAAQNLYKGAAAWLEGRTRACQQGFAAVRHRLRHGHESQVVAELAALVETQQLPGSARETLTNGYHYLKTHEAHIQYDQFKAAGLPIGSGFVESACKWLIQQRFKGVGMRWSEPGFNHLLHLRLAWVNQRFDSFFPPMIPSPN